MTARIDESKWEWLVSITKTHAPGGAWLFEYHGGWHGSEDDAQAFTSLRHAKAYGRDDDRVMRYIKVSDHHWNGYVPEDEV